MTRYECETFEIRSIDLALHFYRRARMNGRGPGFGARLRALLLARREPPATVCERCGNPLDDLEVAHVTVQAGQVCRRCEAGRP